MASIIEKLTDTIGPPVALREIRSGTRFLAAVGRWRHKGVQLNLTDIDTVQLIFNVSGGHVVELLYGPNSICKVVQAGSIAVNAPGSVTSVAVTGEADTVQVVVTKELIEAVTGRPASLSPPQLNTSGPSLRAAAVRALVALTRDSKENAANIDETVRTIASLLSAPTPTQPRSFRGGLSAAARRRVNALIDDRVCDDWYAPLSLSELADAAGLSIHHFVKAFRQVEGETPYARVLARRLDRALMLLLRAEAQVGMVGEMTGFSSLSHFVSAFRRRMGVTPGAVRDAAQGKY